MSVLECPRVYLYIVRDVTFLELDFPMFWIRIGGVMVNVLYKQLYRKRDEIQIWIPEIKKFFIFFIFESNSAIMQNFIFNYWC